EKTRAPRQRSQVVERLETYVLSFCSSEVLLEVLNPRKVTAGQVYFEKFESQGCLILGALSGGRKPRGFVPCNLTLYRRASAARPAVWKSKILERGHFMQKIRLCQNRGS